MNCGELGVPGVLHNSGMKVVKKTVGELGVAGALCTSYNKATHNAYKKGGRNGDLTKYMKSRRRLSLNLCVVNHFLEVLGQQEQSL